MDVKKIFITLITIVICVILGAFVINTLMPNVVNTVINAAEGQIYNATGLSFDFNGDGAGGTQNANSTYNGGLTDDNINEGNQDTVSGFTPAG